MTYTFKPLKDLSSSSYTEDRFRAIVEDAPIGVWLISREGLTLYANEAMISMLGVSLAEIQQKSLFDFVLGEDKLLVEKKLDEAFAGTPTQFQFRLRCQDGQDMLMEAALGLLNEQRGQAPALIGFFSEKSAENYVERNREAIMQALLKSNQELQDFASIISHDLQSPLKKIVSFIDLLKIQMGSALDPKAQEYTERIQKASARMSLLIKSLLEYSKVTTCTTNIEKVDMNKIVKSVQSDLEAQIKEAGADIAVRPLPVIYASPSQMHQLMLNLIQNALKYRGEDPLRVKIDGHLEGPKWVFSVQDNGIGIDPRNINRIFDLFQQVGGELQPGTGIGLSISKKIVENHGGRLWVQSDPHHGSTFFFELPR